MKIAIVGAGAVGTNLAHVLYAEGINIVQIISRNSEHGKKVAQQCGAKYSPHPFGLENSVTHVLLTVPDQFIYEVASNLPKGNYCLIHTSGSTPMESIKDQAEEVGVFYPLQSFSVEQQADWQEIPIFVEANSKVLEDQLFNLARKIATTVNVLDSERRSLLHLSAVFACNFSNYLITIAQDLVKSAGQSESILTPLINETSSRAVDFGAKLSQTGPAKRGDLDTIKKHLDLLSFREDDYAVYKLLSDMLMRRYKS